jgi:hypothetical protein
MAARRDPFAPAALAAGAALLVTAVAPIAFASELDSPMQPIARDAAVPAPLKPKTVTTADANGEPESIRSADRMAPEYPGDRTDPMSQDAIDPMDQFVDRTVDAVENLNSATNSLLRLDRP